MSSTLYKKQREVRKGTFSCWECKHRKARCECRPASSSTCVYCQRRGLPCVSQDFPDPNDGRPPETQDRVVRVEDIIGQLCQQRGVTVAQSSSASFHDGTGNTQNSNRAILNGVAATSISQQHLITSEWINQVSVFPSSRYSTHDLLQSLLPQQATIRLILTQGKFTNLPVHAIRDHGLGSQAIPVQPLSATHLIHTARKLIQLALCMHQLNGVSEIAHNESTWDIAQRYVDVASRSVTSQDSLVDSLDGLETLMLEFCYYLSIGNLRTARLLVRRGIAVAQLLGDPRPGEKAGSRGESIWFRLVYGDR
ncbi:hypothetical protein BT63DRAFT_278660 [Microthyrium microscopicum]|uniref:Zn(2)-C6 fungal-type domain-containing protein n=1 Tax=Microthyrium microscopicum TaxID=703497 RepID=A0A6A6UAM4_9PEZI|nr:hypothetical protein BT63DRAFT_278660 [Microthyrium microscopicum]